MSPEHPPIQCLRCGADITALTADDDCPICSASAARSIPGPRSPFAVHCRCGYDLRGLAADADCPECGTPIAHAVGGSALRFADPAAVVRIALGLRLLSWSCLNLLAIALVLIAGHLVYSALGAFGDPACLDGALHTIAGIEAIAGGVFCVLHVAGGWLSTERAAALRTSSAVALRFTCLLFGALILVWAMRLPYPDWRLHGRTDALIAIAAAMITAVHIGVLRRVVRDVDQRTIASESRRISHAGLILLPVLLGLFLLALFALGGYAFLLIVGFLVLVIVMLTIGAAIDATRAGVRAEQAAVASML